MSSPDEGTRARTVALGTLDGQAAAVQTSVITHTRGAYLGAAVRSAGCRAGESELTRLGGELTVALPTVLLDPVALKASSPAHLSLPNTPLTSLPLLASFVQTPKSDKLVVTQTGASDAPLTDLVGALSAEKASFAYVRVKYANE